MSMNVRSGHLLEKEIIIRPDSASLIRDWSFVPSRASWRIRARRLAARTRRNAAPRHEIIRAPSPARRWNCLFLFAPSGELDHDQHQILARMRALPGCLMVMIAADRIPAVIDRAADALIRKDQAGFDFSAYAIALDTLARCAPGTFAYVQNDSVYGPFATLEDLLARMTWDFTGFIGSAAVENHVSSFAFTMREVTPERVRALAPVLSVRSAYDHHRDVVAMQETRLARIAARHMQVGSAWFLRDRPSPPRLDVRIGMALGRSSVGLPVDLSGDATLALPLVLMDQGFPFLKRSLLGKFAGLSDAAALRRRLTQQGWDVATQSA